MMKSNFSMLPRFSAWVTGLLFAGFSFSWIITAYKYSIIKFISEIQFFHTDFIYFKNYISVPGGLLLYLSSFLSQFYHYPIIGSVILSLILVLIYGVSLCILKHYGDIYRFFSVALIVPVVLLFVYNTGNAGIDVRLAHFLGILIGLLAFLVYIKISDKFRYTCGIALYFLMYFLTAGNALIFTGLLLIDELFKEKKSYLFLLLCLIAAALTPYIAYLFIYVTTLKTAFLNVSPFDSVITNNIYLVAWSAVPIAYLTGRLYLNRKSVSVKKNPYIPVIFNVVLIVCVSVWGVRNFKKKEIEAVLEMAYEVEQGNWDQVIKLGKSKKYSNAVAVPVAYFLNIAHLEKGDLVSEMFTYRQTGTYGLFDSWALNHTTDLYIGELYYRLGVPAIAEQCAFEALVVSPYEHSSKAMRRIVQTGMQRKDTGSFEKYIRLFEKSPVFKTWAKEQREHYEKSLTDSEYKIPGLPDVAEFHNFFFSSGMQEYNFLTMLHENERNKKAFEYFAAFLLLKKDMIKFLELMDAYYDKMNYEKLPRAFEEALIILALNNRPELIRKYGIQEKTIAGFTSLNNDIQKAKTPRAVKYVTEKYKNTYWVYYRYVKPMMLENIPNMSVYQ
ncbi:MAG: DUF6057 family protein [Dysgonamonadaceae bacterium]|nr:DUF6057 family protein [Dysgonamonadaceae bacterium]